MASMIHLYNDQILLPCTSKWNVDLESGLDQIQGLEQKGGACSTTTPSNKRFYNWRLKKIQISTLQTVTSHVALDWRKKYKHMVHIQYKTSRIKKKLTRSILLINIQFQKREVESVLIGTVFRMLKLYVLLTTRGTYPRRLDTHGH